MILKLPKEFKGSYIVRTMLEKFNFNYQENGIEKEWKAEKVSSFSIKNDGIEFFKGGYFIVRIYNKIQDSGMFKKNYFKLNKRTPVYIVDLSLSIEEGSKYKIVKNPLDISYDKIVINAIYPQYVQEIEKVEFPVSVCAKFPEMLNNILIEELTKNNIDDFDKIIKFKTPIL